MARRQTMPASRWVDRSAGVPRYNPTTMNTTSREDILLWAVGAAVAALTFSGWCWWEQRSVSWADRPWYVVFPPLTALGAFLVGAVLTWLWVRGNRSR